MTPATLDTLQAARAARRPVALLTRMPDGAQRLHPDEMLIALSLSSATEPLAARAIEAAEQLRGCDAFFSVIISSADEKLYRTLGINVSCEAKYERSSYYHK